MDQDGTTSPLQYLKMPRMSRTDPYLRTLSFCVYPFKENQATSYVLKVRGNSQFNCLLRMQKLNDGTEINTPTTILVISVTVISEHIDFGWFCCRTRNYYPMSMEEVIIPTLSLEQSTWARTSKLKGLRPLSDNCYRLDTIREHGTIEELVRQFAALTATVEKL